MFDVYGFAFTDGLQTILIASRVRRNAKIGLPFCPLAGAALHAVVASEPGAASAVSAVDAITTVLAVGAVRAVGAAIAILAVGAVLA